ncbi:MAG: hypothetical protein P8Z79_22565 [Sedimentisphaerales bacterium]
MRIDILRPIICSLLVFAFRALPNTVQHPYQDRPFLQDYAEKIPLSEGLAGAELSTVRSDRNGRILVLSDKGLLQVYKGVLVPDRHYRPLLDMHVRGMDTYRQQFIYLADKAVLSNAWAGRFSAAYTIPRVRLFEMGNDFDFLLAGDGTLAYFDQGKCVRQWKTGRNQAKQLLFDQTRNRFLILSDHEIDCFTPGKNTTSAFQGDNLTCLELLRNGSILIVGTSDGYLELDAGSFRQHSALKSKLPCTNMRCVKQIGKSIWFGTTNGAFALRGDGRIDYYASKRWLVDDDVIDVSEGPDNSVLVLSRISR